MNHMGHSAEFLSKDVQQHYVIGYATGFLYYIHVAFLENIYVGAYFERSTY